MHTITCRLARPHYKGFLQVVHLVRDPRGMANSASPTRAAAAAAYQCSFMREDMELENWLPADRWTREWWRGEFGGKV